MVDKRVSDALSALPSEATEMKLVRKEKRAEASLPQWFVDLVEMSGIKMSAGDFLCAAGALALVFALVCVIFDLPVYITLLVCLVVPAVPFVYLLFLRSRLRTKFQEQLPDGIDLMVSVLKSGHSVPQSVRSVSREMANPLGHEFALVLQRMNLGQPLSEALLSSTAKYGSGELDLIARAVSIQAEVGGSLSELLEKTNSTLRQRLKLKRQVRVLTSQSRLTGIIVGILPIVLALALEMLSPGYLAPLFETDNGKGLLALAIFLQSLGIFLMKKMTEVKV
jgi:tight adherence protein B